MAVAFFGAAAFFSAAFLGAAAGFASFLASLTGPEVPLGGVSSCENHGTRNALEYTPFG